jgi:phospholipase C
MKSRHWDDSVFILTYREPGGWYDHVKPPVLNGETYGFRVPTLIISPFAKNGYVDNTVYDTTSILKFIEYNYGLSALSARDAYANNMLNAFNFSQSPRNASIFNGSAIGHVEYESDRNTHSYNAIRVYYLYITIFCSVIIIGLIFWRWTLRRKTKLDSIQDND